MPVDKFGRHLHQHSGDQSQLYVVEDATQLITSLKADIMETVKSLNNRYVTFYLLAHAADEQGRYKLLTGDGSGNYTYKLPTAFIHNIKWSPPNAIISINGKVPTTNFEYIGTLLKSGNVISVKQRNNSKQSCFCEFIMQYPYEEEQKV